MNTKNNRRRRESCQRIESAFIEFLQTRELSQISVSDLCQRAELNRSTFYANYADVYDLADKLRQTLEADVMGLYTDKDNVFIPFRDYLRLFRHIRENQLFYKAYFKLGYDDSHVIALYDVERAARDFDNRYVDYHIEFFKAGFNAIVKRWLAGGCRETPEEMNEIIISEYRGR